MNYIDIRGKWIRARKEKEEILVSVFGGMIDLIQKMAKEAKSSNMDDFVLPALKKEKKSYLDALVGITDQNLINMINQKIKIIEDLLPKMLSEDETIELIKTTIGNFINCESRIPNMGEVMKILKLEPNLDMKFAQSKVQDLINSCKK